MNLRFCFVYGISWAMQVWGRKVKGLRKVKDLKDYPRVFATVSGTAVGSGIGCKARRKCCSSFRSKTSAITSRFDSQCFFFEKSPRYVATMQQLKTVRSNYTKRNEIKRWTDTQEKLDDSFARNVLHGEVTNSLPLVVPGWVFFFLLLLSFFFYIIFLFSLLGQILASALDEFFMYIVFIHALVKQRIGRLWRTWAWRCALAVETFYSRTTWPHLPKRHLTNETKMR